MESQFNRLDSAFRCQKSKAQAFIEEHNVVLPTDFCPECRCDGHCPGLPCPDCGHEHTVPWAILLDTEWGYTAVAISDRKKVLARFDVEGS